MKVAQNETGVEVCWLPYGIQVATHEYMLDIALPSHSLICGDSQYIWLACAFLGKYNAAQIISAAKTSFTVGFMAFLSFLLVRVVVDLPGKADCILALWQNGGEQLFLSRLIEMSHPDILDLSLVVNEQHRGCAPDAKGVGDSFDNMFGLNAGVREELLRLGLRLWEYGDDVELAV